MKIEPYIRKYLSGQLGVLGLFSLWFSSAASAQQFTVQTPIGPVEIELEHAGPTGELRSPPPPEPPGFRPPSVFSAPLPSGSGARALSMAGAFTAVADDATAASWNPAGLIQLQRPEASVVYRFSSDRLEHHSTDKDFQVGENDFSSDHLNYLSLVFPFQVPSLQRNAVVSLNYQEAYDFEHQFKAMIQQGQSRPNRSETTAVFTETNTERSGNNREFIDFTTFSTTMVASSFSQLLNSDLVSELDFRQEGIISAISPAFALEVTPRLSIGGALNVYRNDPLSGDAIRSRTRATYSGQTRSDVDVFTRRTTHTSYEFEGQDEVPGILGDPPFLVLIPKTTGELEPFTDEEPGTRGDTVFVDGVFEEVNEFQDVEGWNANLGVLWVASDRLTLGATVDLPWTADARQTQTVRNQVTTFDESGSNVMSFEETERTESKDVEFRFPAYWAAGALWRWTPNIYSSLDVSQTTWSDFYFQAAGEERVNPLDGSSHAGNELDDTWSVRAGTEYLFVGKKRAVPIRIGAGWEQRPALEEPDDYYSFSAGTGVSVGGKPARIIIDIGYMYTFGHNVRGIVPSQSGLTSDSQEHQVFVSTIIHL
jgi:long-subunit fatty acid transport protein